MEIPTNKKENGKYVVMEIWQSVLQTLAWANTDQKNIVSIVAGAPGFVDKKSELYMKPLILDGKIISGANGTAGEIGHITVERNGSPCNCGRRGWLETISSATSSS